jgi:anti-sigma factor RsiW
MNINRHNYEEYFILYLDNELSSEERSQLELFVQANPDLQQELSMLQQTLLTPDQSVTFDSKETLLRHTATSDITLNNYEEWLLLYIDEELTPDQKITVETFAAANPAIQEELHLLQQAKLQPEENIVFANKGSLLRTEEKKRPVIVMTWRRIAVAAILLLAISMISLFIINTNKPGSAAGGFATNQADTKKTGRTTPALNTTNSKKPAGQTDTTTIAANPPSTLVKREVAVTSNKEAITTAKKAVQNLPASLKKDEPDVATVTTDENTNQSDELIYQPKMKKNLADPVVSFATLTNVKENTAGALVTSGIPQPSLLTDNALSGSDDEDRSEKKNRLRGFLRKVTRVIEKNTNIKATDENDRLLVGGMAIKL